ncbi:HAD family phosphatase [Nonomuraea deserti]|uniref:HAD family phosphatase n=1 Tax=Nonomuraea deserti TaxID=1848322 RepID=A0A4R4W517_9ACTN|nr:HAD family phosphatase [Nonomuraea deserti]
MLAVVRACVFDLDGVLVDSEPVWEEVRRAFVAEHGGAWQPDTQSRLMGMSTAEWAAYLHELGVRMPPAEIARGVVDQMAARYRAGVPLMAGAVKAVRRLAERNTLGLASSSPRTLIDVVLDAADLKECFAATVSTEEVARGKPAPDGYLEAARRLDVDPRGCVAVEDSSNGLRSAHAAGMHVIAVPHPRYPPAPDALALAWRVLPNLDALTPELLS